nr:MAG TPA: hypothetical protein [Caudoviricetes sp.]
MTTTHSSAPSGIADSSHKLDCCRTGPISRCGRGASRARFLPTFCPHFP